jgi:cytochrome c biogenesis protein ResB
MFDWLKSRDRQTADKVLALLAHAIKGVHPNRFIDPSVAGMVAQSKSSQLNLLLGKGDDKRSAAVAFDDLVMAASDYERKGLANELGKVIAHDAVLIALVAAAMHEIRGRAMRGEVRQRANQLLRYVNPTKSTSVTPASRA